MSQVKCKSKKGSCGRMNPRKADLESNLLASSKLVTLATGRALVRNLYVPKRTYNITNKLFE
jgi:hypothetical protein